MSEEAPGAQPTPALRSHSAPQEAAAARLHVQLEPTPADGSFLRTLVAVWLGLCAAAAATAVVLDPVGAFGTGLVRPLIWQGRDEKATLLLRMEPKPQLLILGSSHMMKFDPAAVQRMSGMRAFNFAVSSARAEDELAIFRFVRDTSGGALKWLLIGVDPEAFNNGEAVNELLLQSRFLGRYYFTAPSARIARWGSDLLSEQVLQLSLRSAGLSLRGQTPERGAFAVDPDGLTQYLRWERERASGTPPFNKKVRGTVGDYRNVYRDFTGLDAGRVEALRTLLREAREAGVTVDVFIPPIHPDTVRTLAALPQFAQRRAETEALLRDLADQGSLRLFDVGSLDSFGGDPREFYDGEHMTERNSTRLLLRIYGRDESGAL